MKEDGTPFSNVRDSSQDAPRVTVTERKMNRVRTRACAMPEPAASEVLTLIIPKEIIVINSGNLPLQGIKLLVKIAIIRSRGESMIRHPVTPAALHPSPMAMVRHCFPQAEHFWKAPSML